MRKFLLKIFLEDRANDIFSCVLGALMFIAIAIGMVMLAQMR